MHAPEERNEPIALEQAIESHVPEEEDLTEEPLGHDPARGAGAAVAAASFGAAAPMTTQSTSGGKRALISYDYEKAEDNELELVEGQYVTNIEMVDEDWWMGTNSKGESGLFPSNYVELVEDEEVEEASPAQPSRPSAPSAAPAPASAPEPQQASGPTATTQYDYEAAEDNELSFPDGAKITGLVCSGFVFLQIPSLYSFDLSPISICLESVQHIVTFAIFQPEMTILHQEDLSGYTQQHTAITSASNI